MKLPKAFIPEKDLDKTTESLLNGRNKNQVYSDKVILDGVSFRQLELLADLEGKIDHLKIGFGYMEYCYQLVYTPRTEPSASGSLQLLQKPPSLSLRMLESLGEKVVKSFHDNIAPVQDINDYAHAEYMGSENCLLIDLPIKKNSIPVKKLEEFFCNGYVVSPVTKFSPDQFKFTNVRIYVEYADLKESDMQYLQFIPKEHMLDKSKTYET